jgi:molecular chaperone GrpE
VATNRRIFRSIVHLADTKSWQKAMQTARDRSPWLLTDQDVERHLALSYDFVMEILGNVDAPMAVFRALIGRPRPQVREYSAKFSTRYNLAGLSDNKILKNMSVGGSVRYSSQGSIGFYGLGYTEGMDLTLKMLTSAMTKFGLAEVNPINERFNPELHQAMTVQPSAAVPPHTVLTVYQKGYTLNERLIRPALVIVSQAPPDSGKT